MAAVNVRADGDGVEPWLLALADLPGISPRRLAALLSCGEPAAVHAGLAGASPHPSAALGAVLAAEPATVVSGWRAAAADDDVGGRWEAHQRAGVRVWHAGAPDWPVDALRGLAQPPPLLCTRGDRGALTHPRVALVGTRACTRYGLDVARLLGAELAAAGVAVVSGLALGIDGAAHRGALEAGGAPPIGVVGSGLDVVYPRRHRQLWQAVAERGVLISEHPLGTSPAPWRFPARNRIIAALADVVVVVESHERGGALLTAQEALELGRHVLAVPGSVHSPASSGANALLRDTSPCLGVDDVLLALGLSPAAGRDVGPGGPAAPDGPLANAVLDAVGSEALTAEQVLVRCDAPTGDVLVALQQLVLDGWLVEQGGWFERAVPVVR